MKEKEHSKYFLPILDTSSNLCKTQEFLNKKNAVHFYCPKLSKFVMQGIENKIYRAYKIVIVKDN